MKHTIFILFQFFSFTICFSQIITQVGYYSKNGVLGVTSKNQHMILSNGEIVDNSTPSSPILVGQYSFPGGGHSVLEDGDYAYYGTGMFNSLHIANISNLSFPIHEGSLSFNSGSGSLEMDIAGNILYMARGTSGILASIDVTNKSTPTLRDELSIPGGQCRDIKIHNNYGYAAHYGGLKIIDISNPSDLKVLTTIGNGYNSVDAYGNQVFMGKSSGGIDVFDITSPTNPTPLFSIPNAGMTAHDLVYHDNHLYLATDIAGLFIYELNSNSAMLKVHFPNTGNGQSFGVAIQDNFVLLSGLVNGVATLECEGATTSIPVIQDDEVDIRLFPNPATQSISINSKLLIKSIQFFDTNGRLVKQLDSAELLDQIDISDLVAGKYIVQIETDEQTVFKELLKLE